MNLPLRIITACRRLWHSRTGVMIAAGCRLGPGISMNTGFANGARGRISVGPRAWLEAGVHLHAWGGSVELDPDVFIGPYAVIYGHGGVHIGERTLISMHCRILSSNHSVPELGVDIRSCPDVLMPTRIGRDVWLGSGVTVLAGVTIADGCVVGAGAVVTRDLPAGSICVGTPARVQGWRRGAEPVMQTHQAAAQDHRP